MNNWKISQKLLAAFTLVELSLCAVAAVVLVNLSVIDGQSTLRAQSQQGLAKVDDATKSMLDLSGQVRGFLLTRDEAFANGVATDHAQVQKDIEELRAMGTDTDQKARLEAIAQAAETYVAEAGDPEVRLGRDPTTRDQALAIMNAGVNKRDMNAFKAAARSFEDSERQQLDRRNSSETAAMGASRLALLFGVAIAIGLSALLCWLLTRTIARPVHTMTQTMRRLASGDHKVDVPALGRRDEVGEMAGAVVAFKDAAIEKIRLENETAAERSGVEQERERAEDARAATTHAQTQVVEKLATGLSKLSARDLTFSIPEPFAAEYETLRADFNSAMSSLRQSMQAIAGSTHTVGSGSQEIASASDDLSRRTEQQAASLEETAAALDEITATVKRSAEGAKQANAVASGAKHDALKSGEVMNDAVTAMSEIEQSSNQITQIIGVIDEIAFQTNLLALNAGVEAARAGDAGRGFAVVAQEVRALAQRSAEAAKEIKTLIASSSEQVKRGVRLVGDTGKALDGIAAKVTEIDSLIAEIAQSAQEQAIGLTEVNTAVNQMDQVTQQNAAMVEQATAAAAGLKSEAAELASLVGHF